MDLGRLIDARALELGFVQPLIPPYSTTPLIAALGQTSQPPLALFCTPGHKQGHGIPPAMEPLVGELAYRADLPDLPGFDLFAPEGLIATAQGQAAQVFGADQTWFLVNGSTVGVMASILSTCNPGDKILMPRNVHQSAIAGLILSGAYPVFVQPDYDPHWDLAHCVTPQAVAQALQHHPDIQAILMVSPTYHGVVGNVGAIAQLAHQYNIPLIVDEAHGAHFGFHPALPPAALSQGADLVVQSTHKTLCALTQAAMLHRRGTRVDQARVGAALQLLQSSSPSNLLLASLEGVCQQMATQGLSLMEQTLAIAAHARTTLGKLSHFRLLAPQSTPGFWALDPTRLTLDVQASGLDGFAVDERCAGFGVIAELPTHRHLTFIVSVGNVHGDVERLGEALGQIQAMAKLSRQSSFPALPDGGEAGITYPALSPRDAFFAPRETVPLEQAVDRICTETLCPYPPGIPILMPGERCTAAALDALLAIRQAGGHITGGYDSTLRQIQVVRP